MSPSGDAALDDVRMTPVVRGGIHGFEGNGHLPNILESVCVVSNGEVVRIAPGWRSRIPAELLWRPEVCKIYYACPRCCDCWV